MLGLVFCCSLLKAQQIDLSTTIKDKSGTGIPYASMVFRNTQLGTYADSVGKINLSFTKIKTDTLVISAIGYKDKIFNFNDLPKIIILEDDIETLQVAEVNSRKKRTYQKSIGEKKRNFIKFRNSTMRGNKGVQYAFFLQNIEGKEGIIKNIYFNLDNDRKVKGTKIRVRLYSRASNKKSPDKDLVDKSIVVDVTSSGILKVDLEQYNIVFPIEGCFLGLDLLGNGNEKAGGLVYPHLLGYYPRESKNIFTEGIWSSFMGSKKWHQLPKIQGIGKDLPYFGMDILYFKD